MKKTFILAMVAMFSLLTAAPALAASENVAGPATVGPTQIKKQIMEEVKKNPKVRVGHAQLVKIKGNELPTELVVKVIKKVKPKKEAITASADKLLEAEKLYTIKVNQYTHFVRRYWGKSSLQELTVGDKLFLVVLDYGNGNYRALLVKDNSIFWRSVRGRIASIDYASKTFVLVHKNKKLKVKVTNKTKLIVPGILNPTFKDLRVGQRVKARGVINGRLKTMDSRLVRVLKPWPVIKKAVDAVKI